MRTRRGARILKGQDIVSEVVRRPGPTHTPFDVQAATIATLAPGPRVALLGFGGGSLIAPLRALEFGTPLVAVDRWREGTRLFRRLCGRWAGAVRVTHTDIAAWLGRGTQRYDLFLEDIAPLHLPASARLIRARLKPGGVAVFNLLREDEPVRTLVERVAEPFAEALEVRFLDFDNRIVVASRRLPSAREVSRLLRASLRGVRSRLAERIRVRTLD